MEDKIKEILSSILDVEKAELTMESSPENLHKWDSLNHMNIITALEEEYDVTFSEEDIIEMLSIGSIVRKLNENL